LPDELVTWDANPSLWLKKSSYSGQPFPPGSLGKLNPLPFYPLQFERMLAFALYFSFNFVPTTVGGLGIIYALSDEGLLAARLGLVLVLYLCGLYLSWKIVCYKNGWKFSMVADVLSEGPKVQINEKKNKACLKRQFGFTSRNTEKLSFL